MGLSLRLGAILAFAAALLGPAGALAAAKDAVLNKEGFWGIDVDHGACAATMALPDGTVFLFRAKDGDVTFGLFARAPLPRAKALRLEVDAASFDLPASYSGDTAVFYNDALAAHVLAALRHARSVRVLADGRTAAAMTFEGTGFEGALDGIIACSKGENGWWGLGVGAKRVGEGPVPDKSVEQPVMNKEGAWALGASTEPGVCVAQAVVDHISLQILGAGGQIGLAVSSDKAPLPRGRRGRVQTDSYAFEFMPQYGVETYMTSDQPFDRQAVSALHRAKWFRVSVDGRTVVDAALDDSGFPELLDAVAACSRGETGWWGNGAATAR
jgi:hypothetical protein